tara:strand:+ start:6768 stop:7778 length:1011 start_codon:yes stop_codon:yes gene_type:complete
MEHREKTSFNYLSKRQFTQLSFASLTTLFVPSIGSYAKGSTLLNGSLYNWRGSALGTDASILIEATDETVANDIFDHCEREIRRLENVFSLYLPTSAVTRLNRDGKINNAPPELFDLVSQCIRLGSLTDGAFDITIQSLWKLYASHFYSDNPNQTSPSEGDRAKALELVDYSKINVTSDQISFDVPDMAITLNGVAPGYVTDKITALLLDYGITNALVDIGETRSLGRHPSDRPWEIGVIDSKNPKNFDLTMKLMENEAVASSSRYGLLFDSTGRNHHLFDRFTGKSAMYNNGVTVVAPTATTADALSTAFGVMPRDKVDRYIRKHADIKVLFATS